MGMGFEGHTWDSITCACRTIEAATDAVAFLNQLFPIKHPNFNNSVMTPLALGTSNTNTLQSNYCKECRGRTAW